MICDNSEREHAFIEHFLHEVNSKGVPLEQAVFFTCKQDQLCSYPQQLTSKVEQALKTQQLTIEDVVENISLKKNLTGETGEIQTPNMMEVVKALDNTGSE